MASWGFEFEDEEEGGCDRPTYKYSGLLSSGSGNGSGAPDPNPGMTLLGVATCVFLIAAAIGTVIKLSM